jgi:hypothetical protein
MHLQSVHEYHLKPLVGSRDYLNVVTICGQRWTWFRVSNTKVHSHLIERAGLSPRGSIPEGET